MSALNFEIFLILFHFLRSPVVSRSGARETSSDQVPFYFFKLPWKHSKLPKYYDQDYSNQYDQESSIRRNKNKVNSIKAGGRVIAHLSPWGDQGNCRTSRFSNY